MAYAAGVQHLVYKVGEKLIMAGLHFSPFLPPFPGVGVCKAMSADTCPYGGADTHIITEYLPPEMQEMLLGDPPIYPPRVLSIRLLKLP